MVDRKVMEFALATVMVVGVFGPHVATMIQTAEGHGVQAQLQSRFIRIEDETFNRQSLQTGEVLTLSGAFVSLIDSDMRAWSSICLLYTSPSPRDKRQSRMPSSA